MTSDNQLDFSVVLCAYTDERWRELSAAIASAQAQTVPPREIIVVVDHNEALLERVRSTFPAVLAVPNSEPRGLSGARNSGIALAQGAIIAFLDDDARAAADWLEQLRAGYDDPQVMGVGGSIEPHWEAACPDWFPEEFTWVVGCTYRGLPLSTGPVRNLIGANMSFRRELLHTLGGFQHSLGRVGKQPLGCEETELCIRAHQRWPECTLRYVPAARVLHSVPAARGQWAYFRARCYAEGLSKAQVARLVGSQDGLASERAYATRTLPLAVLRAMAQAIARGDRACVKRAAAIVAGLGITAAGYFAGHTAQLLALRHAKRVQDDIPAIAP